jgi:hypothetical protein
MKKNIKDRDLDTPSEANRDKHINFVALENNDQDPADFEVNGPLNDRGSAADSPKTTYNFVIDQVPYMVQVQPFSFNGETRFYIQVNNGPEHVFTWDSELRTIRAIDEDASMLPDELETAISRKLQTEVNKQRI